MKNDFDIDSIPVQTLILLTLKDGDKYGYEIKDGIEKLTENQIEVKQANLYSSLKKLEQMKLISSYWRDSDIGGKRHYYFLTDNGKEELKKSDIENLLSESLSSKQDESNNSFEFFDKDSTKSSGGFFGSQGVDLSPINDDIVPSADSLNNKKLESFDLTPEIVSEDVLNKKNNQSTLKQELEELPRIESNDVVLKSKAQTQIQNTDIDYKNILGELYSPECGSVSSEPTNQLSVVDASQEEVFSEPVNLDESPSDIAISDQINNRLSSIERDEKYIDKIINKSVKVSNYSNFGINVKRHSKASEVLKNDDFYKISSLRFMESIFIYLLIALEICVAYLFVRNSGVVLFSDFKIFAIIGAIFVLYPVACLTICLIYPNKKKKIEFNFKNSLIYRILITFIFIMFVVAMNFLFGMTNLNQVDYMIFWLLPSLLSLNIVFEAIIFKILLISGKYNC